MERHLIHRAVVHRQATQFVLRIADELPAILNVILRSLPVTYGSVLNAAPFENRWCIFINKSQNRLYWRDAIDNHMQYIVQV